MKLNLRQLRHIISESLDATTTIKGAEDKARTKLLQLVNKYSKYNAKNRMTGGQYYGGVAVANFENGKIELLGRYQVHGDYRTYNSILGITVGKAWVSDPDEGAKGYNHITADAWRQKREKLIKEIFAEAEPILLEFIGALQLHGVEVEQTPRRVAGQYFIAHRKSYMR